MTTALWKDQARFRDTLPQLIDLDLSSDTPHSLEYRRFYQLPTQACTHQVGVFRADHFDLVGQVFQPIAPSKGTLFLYHGYFDHLGLYGFLIKLGIDLGFNVVGFDLPGHGLSSGPFASIDCFSRYSTAQDAFMESIKVLSLVKPWFAAGQSTGAAVILDTVLVRQQRFFEGLIFLAPLVRVANWYRVRLLYQILRHRGGTARTFRNNSSDEVFVNFLRDQDPLQHRRIEAPWVGAMIRYTKRILRSKPSDYSPLVLQGDFDETVDFTFNIAALQRFFQQPKIVMLHGARHHLVNESLQYRAIMEKEIRTFICPSYPT